MVCPHLKLKPRQSEITFTSHILDLLFSLPNFPSAFMSHPSLTLFVNFVSIGIMHLLQSKIVEWRLRYGLFMVTLTKSNKTLENESMEIGDNKTHPILGPDSCLNLLKWWFEFPSHPTTQILIQLVCVATFFWPNFQG